jgi:hypothetical protein
MARSDLFSAIYDTPMRIATSFFRSTPEGNFVSFLNGNFVFVGSVFNRLIKGESIDSLTSFIAFTKADGQLIRFSTLPVEYQNVFKNFVI